MSTTYRRPLPATRSPNVARTSSDADISRAKSRRYGVQVWRSVLPSMARRMVIRRCRQVVAEDLRSLRRRDNTGVVSWSSERLVLSHMSRVFWGVPRFGRFWRWPAKPLADGLLVFGPVVGQHSL